MKLAVILGAVREGRQSPRLAKWVMNMTEAEDNVEAELIDLRNYQLPIFNESVSPRYNPERKPNPEAQKWLDKLAEFEAYIFVTPEYNHSIPGALKNAIDYIDWQLQHKPAAVVAHGSAGGARAEVALKEILSESRAILVPTIPGLTFFQLGDTVSEAGKLSKEAKANPYGPYSAFQTMFEDLRWYSDALVAARK